MTRTSNEQEASCYHTVRLTGRPVRYIKIRKWIIDNRRLSGPALRWENQSDPQRHAVQHITLEAAAKAAAYYKEEEL